MINQIRKRDGKVVRFQPEKIAWAIFKAAQAVGGDDYEIAEKLTTQVLDILALKYKDTLPEVEDVQDIVEKVLIENGHAKTAKAYILYREKRRSARESNALIGATIDMFSDYLDDKDWQVSENANTGRSINGMNNYIRETLPSSTGCTRYTRRPPATRIYRATSIFTTWGSSAPTARAGTCGSCCATGSAACPARWNPTPQSICGRCLDRW